jgi:TPR repeat protein
LRDITSAKMEARAEATEELGRHLASGKGDVDEATHERAVQALVGSLSDVHPAVRSRAATALADAGATSALPSLLVAVEDDDAFVRQMALSALGELGDPRATSKLTRALADSRPEVRYQALIAFVRVCPEDSGKAIAKALDDADCAVRHIALRLAEDAVEQGNAQASVATWSREAQRLLDDEHADVAVAAAIFLTKCTPASDLPKAAKALLLAVARGEKRGEVGTEEEQGALEACGEAKLVEAIPALERRAYGLARLVRDTSVLHAKSALAALGHTRAQEELLADLASEKPERRDKAIVAVGRARLAAARSILVRLAKEEGTRELANEALSRLLAG